MTEDRIFYLIALPIILIAVVVEYIINQKEKKQEIAVITSNLLCGTIDRLFFLFFGLVQFQLLKIVSQHSFFNPVENNFFTAILLFIIVDFTWYWYHHIAHRLKILWSFHQTHHQTSDYSFSLGLRVSFLQQFIRTFFWLPIALLGFDPLAILIAIFFQSFYQFFTHTELYEYPKFMNVLFVTPSYHKIHHSNQKAYHNFNFGGVFVVWDKLFGTYKSPVDIEDEIILKKQVSFKELSPFNAYFTPFLNYIFSLKKASEKKHKFIGKTNQKPFLILLSVLLFPALLLIIFSGYIKLTYLIILSLILIGVIFISSHIVFTRKYFN